MDRLFRRFELNLGDLATLRNLPELRSQVDRLKPGELLRFMHRDGELVGLERKLSDSETLKVTRDANGFSSDVLENPLEMRTRTASATIENSLFQAAADAELSDRVAFDLAEIFQYDIDFVLDIQSGDRFTVVYEEVFQDGVPLRIGNILAAKFVNDGREYRAVRYVDETGHGRVLHPGRQEPAQGVHPRAGAVLAHQLALQSVAPASGAESHPRASRRRLRGAGRHAGARRRRRPRAIRRAAGRLRQCHRARARLRRGHRLRSPVALRTQAAPRPACRSRRRSSATSA